MKSHLVLLNVCGNGFSFPSARHSARIDPAAQYSDRTPSIREDTNLPSTVPSLGKRREGRQQAAVLPFRSLKNTDFVTESPRENDAPKSKIGENSRGRELASVLRRINNTATFRQRSDLASFVNWKGN